MSRTFGNFYTLLYFYSALCAFLTKKFRTDLSVRKILSCGSELRNIALVDLDLDNVRFITLVVE